MQRRRDEIHTTYSTTESQEGQNNDVEKMKTEALRETGPHPFINA